MYKHLYQKFLNKHPQQLHFAAHSHHFWPDVTREATLQYWEDSATYVDDKWEFFMTEKIPAAQKLIAEILDLSQPENIVFAPNTHELVFRLLSSLDMTKTQNILTTDSEFYSWQRQSQRWQESSHFHVTEVPTQPFENLEDRLIQMIQSKHWDVIFLSQVFFNSGFALKNFEKIAQAASPETIFILDGYHAFMAIPTSLKKIEHRIFYVAGSYKYAQGGEGCCFMTIPENCQLRPLQTGWFAGLADLSQFQSMVGYANNGYRFAGSTMDFSALYRLESVLKLFKDNQITVDLIHDHVQSVQKYFLDLISQKNHPLLNQKNLLIKDLSQAGHFLTFEMPSTDICQRVQKKLKDNHILTDSRKNRLRFGFGMYHDKSFDLNFKDIF